MKISKKYNGTTLEITLEGRLDTVTAPDLEKEFDACLEEVTELIMDFSDLEYISSAGLRTLLIAQKTMQGQGTMKIIHVNEIVREVFELTGFTNIITIE